MDQTNEISAADRETAAAILARQTTDDHWFDRQRFLEEVAAGRHDEISIVQAMARHRRTAELAALREGIDLGLQVAARIVHSHSAQARAVAAHRLTRDDLEATILAMSVDDILENPLPRRREYPHRDRSTFKGFA